MTSDPFIERTDALARSFRAGDAGAYDELSRLLVRRLARVGRQITGDEHEAQDVAQEALVQGFRSIEGWDGRGSFVGWLLTIAARCAIDRRRRAARDEDRRRLFANRVAGNRESGPQSGVVGVAAERREAVRDALAELTDNQRVTVVLRHFEGLSLAEIAALRGTSVGTIKATLFQAFSKLRQRLRPPEESL